MTLREARQDRGLSLRQLEERTGISRGTLSQIERGRLIATEYERSLIGFALGGIVFGPFAAPTVEGGGS